MLFIHSHKISKLKDLDQKIPTFPNCDNYGVCRSSNPNPTSDDVKLNDNALHQQIYTHFKVDCLEEMDIIKQTERQIEQKINETLLALLPNKIIQTSKGPVTATEHRTSTKTIMPVLDVLKGRIADTNQRLTSQYRMMQMAHHRYNLLFRWTHEMLMIHHFALLLFKNYLTIQLHMLQRIHHQYNRYESSLDDTLIGIESLSSGYLTHRILNPKVLARYLEAIADDLEDTASDYKPVFIVVYQYYGNLLASFTNTIDDLILQLPILIKLKV